MLLLFSITIYPHYYSWWMYVNYYNDDFYNQYWHQLFFTVTELISTTIVMHLINSDNLVTTRKILMIMGLVW